MSKNVLITIFVVAVLIFTIFMKESREELSDNFLNNDSTILAFGDSLTYGFGASQNSSYPVYLQNKTGFNVINAGVNGELSSEGLERLPSYLQLKPKLVILCHGGNDILQNLSKEQLKKNLLKMIKMIKKSGADVLLVAVPDFNLFNFKTLSIYEDIADETNVMFEHEVLTYIELHRSLKSDYVHPNSKGYEMMADSFIEILKTNRILH